MTETDQDYWSPLLPRDPDTGFPVACRAGPFIFVAGVSGLIAASTAPPGHARAQCHNALEALRRVLNSVEAGLEDVCQMTVYVAREDDRPDVTATMRAAFVPRLPAAAFFTVPLRGEERVRVAATAVRGNVPGGRRRRVLGTLT